MASAGDVAARRRLLPLSNELLSAPKNGLPELSFGGPFSFAWSLEPSEFFLSGFLSGTEDLIGNERGGLRWIALLLSIR